MAENKEKTKQTEQEEQISEENVEQELSETEKALAQENETLIKENEELKKKADEFKDKWVRNVAEFDNYKKRTAKDWQNAFFEGSSSVLLKILPIGDNLDIAISMCNDEKTKEGLILLRRKFDDILKNMEVVEINPVGETFDPNVAEAVMQVPKADGETEDTIKQVFEKGYKIKDRIIRYAKVSVIK